MSRPNILLGASLAAAAGIGFAANSTAAKVAYEGGTNPLTFLTLRSTLAAVLVLLIILATGRSLRLPPGRRLAAFGLGALVALYSYGTLGSIQYIPVALAILILYTFPLLTSIYAWVSGQERPTVLSVGALLAAFVGLVLALDIGGGALDIRGVGLAAMAALGLTAVIILNNRLVGAGDSRPITFHMMLSASVIFAIVTWVAGDYALPTTMAGWTGFLIGPAAYAAAIVTVFVAISLAGPAPAAMSMNVEPVASLTFGFLILGQALGSVQILGAGLVIAAVVSLRLADMRIPGLNTEKKP